VAEARNQAADLLQAELDADLFERKQRGAGVRR
jgi:hypothetical protein